MDKKRRVGVIGGGGSGCLGVMVFEDIAKAAGYTEYVAFGYDLDASDRYAGRDSIHILDEPRYRDLVKAANEGTLGEASNRYAWLRGRREPKGNAPKGAALEQAKSVVTLDMQMRDALRPVKAAIKRMYTGSRTGEVVPTDWYVMFSACGGTGSGLSTLLAMAIHAYVHSFNRKAAEAMNFHAVIMGERVFEELVDVRQKDVLAQNSAATFGMLDRLHGGAMAGKELTYTAEGITWFRVPASSVFDSIFLTEATVTNALDAYLSPDEGAAVMAGFVAAMALGHVGDQFASDTHNARDGADFRPWTQIGYNVWVNPTHALQHEYLPLCLAADLALGASKVDAAAEAASLFGTMSLENLTNQVTIPADVSVLNDSRVGALLDGEISSDHIVRVRQALFGVDDRPGAIQGLTAKALAAYTPLGDRSAEVIAELTSRTDTISNPSALIDWMRQLTELAANIDDAIKALAAQDIDLAEEDPQEAAQLRFGWLRFTCLMRNLPLMHGVVHSATEGYIHAVEEVAQKQIVAMLRERQLDGLRQMARDIRVMAEQCGTRIAELKLASERFRVEAEQVVSRLMVLDGRTVFVHIAHARRFESIYKAKKDELIAAALGLIAGTSPNHIFETATRAVAAYQLVLPSTATESAPVKMLWALSKDAPDTLFHELGYTVGPDGTGPGTVVSPYVSGRVQFRTQCRPTDFEGLRTNRVHPLEMLFGSNPQTAETIAAMPDHVAATPTVHNGAREPVLATVG